MSIKKILFLAVVLLLGCLPLATSALSLGELTTFSGRGQPLQAEVNLLSLNPATQLRQINASIPPAAIFQRFGLQRDPFLDQLRLKSAQTAQGYVIKLSSAQAFPASPLALLLEIEVDGERTLKKYQLVGSNKRAAAKPNGQLPVPVPSNVLSKKVPQHVTFEQPNPVVKPPARHKQTAVQSAQVLPLPVAKPLAVAESMALPVPTSINGVPIVPIVNEMRDMPAELFREGHGRDGLDEVDAYTVAVQDDWQSEQDYYREYRLPAENLGSGGGYARPTDQQMDTRAYINYVPVLPPVETAQPTHHRVKRGDTLFKIAARYKVSGVSTHQMMLALHQKNAKQLPTIAHIDKLSIGQRLRLPTVDEMWAVSRAQGAAFKRAYLKQHQQRLAQKRKAAQRQRVTAPAAAPTDQPPAKKPVAAKSAATQASVANPTALQNRAGVVAPADTDATGVNSADASDNQVKLLEGRLRKVKRLLDIEKQKHATTKQVVKEKNRLIQRKNSLIRGLQPKGVQGNKAVAAVAASAGQVALSAAAEPNDTPASSMRPAEAQSTARANPQAVVHDVEPFAETLAATSAALWGNLSSQISRFFLHYPLLSVLAVVFLLGLLLVLLSLLMFKPGRKKRSQSYAEYGIAPVVTEPEQSANAARQPRYSSAHPQNNAIPSQSQPADVAPVETPTLVDPQPPQAITSSADQHVLSMNGQGQQTLIINISAPARLNIDMATENDQLATLRQQTDKLCESLRSLEQSSQAIIGLTATDSDVGPAQA